jgi:hypothetical protein
MASSRFKRYVLITLSVLALLAGGVLLGFHFAVQALKGKVEQALGPDSEVGEIVVGASAIEVRNLRIRAPKGWPAEDTLRAERIVIEPDLRELVSSRQVRIRRITVESPYLSILRTPDGRLRLLPSLLEKKSEGAPPAPPITIGTVELNAAVLEFFDTTVRRPPHKLRLEQLHATLEDLELPALKSRTQLGLDGVVKGVQRDGSLAIKGWIQIASKDSDIDTRLRGVDLIALQPYLIKASEAGVKRGTLDLDLKSAVRNNHLRAPGTMTLSHLELSSSGTFMGMPRRAVLAALKNRNDQITVKFTLEGNLNDPKFSLNESFAKRLGTSMAEGLGVSIEGLAKGVGEAAQGLGGTLKRLFGK